MKPKHQTMDMMPIELAIEGLIKNYGTEKVLQVMISCVEKIISDNKDYLLSLNLTEIMVNER